MLFIKRLREKKLLVSIAFIIVVILLFIVQRQIVPKKDSISSETTLSTPTKEVEPDTGLLILKTQDDRKIYISGEQINLLAFADSMGSMVSGFDIVVEYSPQQLDYTGYEDLDERYDVAVKNIENKLFITGSQKLNVEQVPVLKDSPLVQLAFKARMLGMARVSISFEKSKNNESNIIDVSSNDILTKVINPELFIGKKIYVVLNSPYSLNDETEVTLDLSQPAAEGCFDCITSAQITVSNRREKASLEFKSGGIAGIVANLQEAFGYSFEIGTIEKGRISLYYAENTK